MNVCRSCLRQQLGLARAVSKLSRSKSIQRRHAATYPYHHFVPPTKPTPWSQDPEDLEIFNSYTLATKIDHLLRMKSPESVQKLLNKSRMKDAIFSWNLLIKYYAKLGEWDNVEKAYQQLKKTGAKPILDTYVQMAHCINTLQRLLKGQEPPKVRYTLDIVKRLDEFDDWSDHKGIGIFMTIVVKAFLRLDTTSDRETVLPQLIAAANKVWEKTNPFDHDTKLSEEDKERLLTHYLFALSHSANNDDLKFAVSLLPRLLEFPSTESRRSALRIALCLNDSEMAKSYWHKFPSVPFDETSAVLYLRVLSQGFLSKDAADILDQIIAAKSSQREPKVYLLALLSCLRLPNLNTAMRIYDKVLDNPRAKGDFYINELMLRIFARATESNYSLRKHKPDYIYSILRTLNMPNLMKQKHIPTRKRLELVEKAKQIISWRANAPGISRIEQQVLEGDVKFYERWENIIENSDTPKETKQIPFRQRPSGGNLNRSNGSEESREHRYDRYLSSAPTSELKKSTSRNRNSTWNQNGTPHAFPPRKYAPAHNSLADKTRLSPRNTPPRNMRSGVDQRRFASRRSKKKKKGPNPSRVKRTARRLAERMGAKTRDKLVAQEPRPRVSLSHLDNTVTVPHVKKGSNVRDINSIKPLNSKRYKGRNEDFTRSKSSPRIERFSKAASMPRDTRETSNRTLPSSRKWIEKGRVEVVEDSFQGKDFSTPRQDRIGSKIRSSIPDDRRTVKVVESIESGNVAIDPEANVMSMSAEDRIRLSQHKINGEVVADKAQETKIRGGERNVHVDAENEVMSMSVEDRIRLSQSRSNGQVIADVIPSTRLESDERKEPLDSEAEVISMSAEDRINATRLAMGHRSSVSKAVQFNDRSTSTAANPLSEAWSTNSAPSSTDVPVVKPLPDSLSNNDKMEPRGMKGLPGVGRKEEESRFERLREVMAQNQLRRSSSAFGRWTQNKQKGWELIRRAEMIDSKTQQQTA